MIYSMSVMDDLDCMCVVCDIYRVSIMNNLNYVY